MHLQCPEILLLKESSRVWVATMSILKEMSITKMYEQMGCTVCTSRHIQVTLAYSDLPGLHGDKIESSMCLCCIFMIVCMWVVCMQRIMHVWEQWNILFCNLLLCKASNTKVLNPLISVVEIGFLLSASGCWRQRERSRGRERHQSLTHTYSINSVGVIGHMFF